MISSKDFLKKVGMTEDASLQTLIEAFDVLDAYEGEEPYIFISYAHKDSPMVLPAIRALQMAGYPVWYDAGIQAGSEWPAYIAEHIENSTLFIAFLTKNAVESIHCRAEVTYAFSNYKNMLSVRLDDAPLPKGMAMQLGLSQMFNAFACRTCDAYINSLVRASTIREHVAPVLRKQVTEQPQQTAEEQEAARKAAEARRAEEVRKAEEARAAEEARKAEEARREEAARKAEEARIDQDRAAAVDHPEEKPAAQTPKQQTPSPVDEETARKQQQARIEQELEEQLRMMMAGGAQEAAPQPAEPEPEPVAEEADEETARRLRQERIERELEEQFRKMMESTTT